jgi:hypothetical protein
VESRQATEFAVNWIRAGLAKTPPGEVTYLYNRPFEAVPPAVLTPAEFPGWAAIYVIFFPNDDDKPIRFVQTGNHVIEAARRGRRSASLLISRSEWHRAKLTAPAAKATADP